jgi:hypothetical protein
MHRKSRKELEKYIDEPIFDESTFRAYAKDHSLEQTLGYLEGMNAIYNAVEFILHPRHKSNPQKVDTVGKEKVFRDLMRFIDHKIPIVQKLNSEYQPLKDALEQSTPDSGTTLQP